MKKILIIQSSAPDCPQWVRECMHSVELWSELNGYQYVHVGDELFQFAPQYREPFTKVTRSDICRLRVIEAHMNFGYYDAAYWIDADFLIWNIYEFALPMPVRGSVVCAREAYFHTKGTTPMVNNSIVGFAHVGDVRVLIGVTEAMLDHWLQTRTTAPRMTYVGTDLFSSWRFPLKQIIAKQAGCLSDQSISLILGPWISGRRHLFWLSMANGDTLRGANLCSSRERDQERMGELVKDLIQGQDLEIGRFKSVAGIYRAYLVLVNIPFRIRCWAQTRIQKIRKSLIPA
jgi:hypothetical protein